jgi:hypothetical protein
MGDQVCVWMIAGPWLHVSYERRGRMFTDWVHGKFVAAE